MKKILPRIITGFLLACLVIAAILFIRHRKAQLSNMAPPKERRLPVVLKSAKYGELALTRHYIGTIEPMVEAVLSAQTTGYLTAVHKNEGDQLAKGEVVAEIDLRLAAAQKRTLEADLAGAKKDLATKEIMRDRRRKLIQNKVVSQENLDEVELAADLSAARVRRIEQELAAAEVTLSFAHVHSLFDGTVTDRLRNIGDLVAPGTPIIRVEDSSKGYRVLVRVSQEIAADFPAKAPAKLIFREQTIDVTVDRVHPAIDNGSLATLEIRIPTRPFNLPSHGSVGVDLTVAKLEGWVLDSDCILETDVDSMVFAVSEDMTVTPIPVTVRGWNGPRAIVEGPLKDGISLASGPESMLMVLNRDTRILPVSGDTL